jgi:hypothetical protein
LLQEGFIGLAVQSAASGVVSVYPLYCQPTITITMPHVLLAFFASQLFVTPPIPTQSFDGQTIIVTGASAGLGLACTTHLARLNALRVILAVRSLEKGERARKQVETAVPGCKTRLDVWQLDLSSFESIRQFATRVNAECPQVNGLVQNAGILTEEWRVAEGMEEQAMVHAVGPNLLALMIRNKLAESAKLVSTYSSKLFLYYFPFE